MLILQQTGDLSRVYLASSGPELDINLGLAWNVGGSVSASRFATNLFLCYSFHAMLYSINVISVITECSVLRGCAAALNASGFHVHVEAQTGLRRDSKRQIWTAWMEITIIFWLHWSLLTERLLTKQKKKF